MCALVRKAYAPSALLHATCSKESDAEFQGADGMASNQEFQVTIISMTTFVQIVVNVPAVSGIFDYSIPDALLGKMSIGQLVTAPFGKQTVQGVVFRFIDQPSVPDVKEIMELVDPVPVMTQAQITLAEAMAEATLASLASMVSL